MVPHVGQDKKNRKMFNLPWSSKIIEKIRTRKAKKKRQTKGLQFLFITNILEDQDKLTFFDFYPVRRAEPWGFSKNIYCPGDAKMSIPKILGHPVELLVAFFWVLCEKSKLCAKKSV
jgi:hypothetical protein